MTIGSITTAVAETIAGAAPALREGLIKTIAEVEIKKRADMLVTAMAKYGEWSREASKVRADNVVYNADGSKASEGWSKKQLEAKKKADEQLGRLVKAIETALEANTAEAYAKLGQIVSQKSGTSGAADVDAG